MENREVCVGRDDVDVIGPNPRAVFDFPDREGCAAGEGTAGSAGVTLGTAGVAGDAEALTVVVAEVVVVAVVVVAVVVVVCGAA